jgi:hypothetical protein
MLFKWADGWGKHKKMAKWLRRVATAMEEDEE